MIYNSTFKNINGVQYDITITTDVGESSIDFIMTNSFQLNTHSSSLFSPIKSRSLSLEMFTKDYYMGLYQPSARGAEVIVKLHDNNEIIFRGNLTPNIYDQDFTGFDTVTLEAVDAISTAKNIKHVNTNDYDSFFDIMMNIIKDCGYEGYLHVPQTYEKVNGDNIDDDILKILHVSSANFIDDDDLHTPQKNYDVLEQILTFLGWTLTIQGDDVILIDYRAISTGNDITYKKYDIVTSSLSDTYQYTDSFTFTQDNHAAGTSSISIDPIYNKIEISDNLYEIDDISPDIFEEENHISINKEKNFDYNTTQWEKTERSGWWLWKKETQVTTGTDYQTICRITPNSGWKHQYWKHSTIFDDNVQPLDNQDGMGYYDENGTVMFNNNDSHPINKYCNTHGCLIQHYAYKSETTNNLPTNLDWSDYLTFFICNDTTPDINYTEIATKIPLLEKPVLIYEPQETIFFKPATGTSWITIKGDLFYQNNQTTYGEKDKDVFEVINYDKGFYITAPCDKAIQVNEKQYLGVWRTEKDYQNYYYSGFDCWKMSVQIGDKFWTEHWDTTVRDFVGGWVTKENENDPDPTFYIHYNNAPTENGTEFLPAFQWISPLNNHDFKDRVGVDGYSIPISSTDPDAPSKGKLKITIYTPSVIPETLRPLVQAYYMLNHELSQSDILSWLLKFDNTFRRDSIPWVIYAKDFEIGYVYTDTQEWYKSHKDDIKKDKVYTGYIDDDYVKDFSTLEFKINTSSKDRPISRSYVTTATNYVGTIKHIYGDEKIQEYNVIDMYLDHHNNKKVIYKAYIHELKDPRNLFISNNISGTMVIDSQSYDIYNDINTARLIVY